MRVWLCAGEETPTRCVANMSDLPKENLESFVREGKGLGFEGCSYFLLKDCSEMFIRVYIFKLCLEGYSPVRNLNSQRMNRFIDFQEPLLNFHLFSFARYTFDLDPVLTKVKV